MWRGVLKPITGEAMQNLTFCENIFSLKFKNFSFSVMAFACILPHDNDGVLSFFIIIYAFLLTPCIFVF